jgi:hypothetical protein
MRARPGGEVAVANPKRNRDLGMVDDAPPEPATARHVLAGWRLWEGILGLDQIGIALSGVIAVWLTQDKRDSWRRWACIFGILGQPFWFYAAWSAEQWGIFALCMLYTYAWARGLWTHWLGPYIETLVARVSAHYLLVW